jgi:hypothetical protein
MDHELTRAEPVNEALRKISAVQGYECRMPIRRSFGRRLLDRLFPYLCQPDPEWVEGFTPGYCRNRTVMVLDWKDRLRVLVSGRVNLEQVHQTDVQIGKLKTVGTVCILPPGFRP